ncbi:MAG TPA: CinA family protein [Alcanivorax sp.]|nr:CinA family protein [Alcanivorax sp.]
MQGLANRASELGKILQQRRLSVVTAESCTGGGIARLLTDDAGASGWFERGFVTYSNLSKEEMLGVPRTTLETHGAVSEETVLAMARGALRHSNGDVSISVSGVAGPDGGTPEKPVGTVWIGWGLGDGVTEARHYLFPGDRDEVRSRSMMAAIEGLIERLNR